MALPLKQIPKHLAKKVFFFLSREKKASQKNFLTLYHFASEVKCREYRKEFYSHDEVLKPQKVVFGLY